MTDFKTVLLNLLEAAKNHGPHDLALAVAIRIAEEASSSPWQPIATAPIDREVLVYAPGYGTLGEIFCRAKYHPNAGFCVDELRQETLWVDLPENAPAVAVTMLSPWQPIETAPTGPEPVLMLRQGRRHIAYRDPDGRFWSRACLDGNDKWHAGITLDDATHWAPFPALPAGSEP